MESGGIDSRDSHLPSTIAPASERYNDYGANEYNVDNNGSSNNAVFFLNEQRKAALGFDLAVLNPPYVFGPNIHDVDKPENLGESMRDWYKNVVTGGLSDDALVFAPIVADSRPIEGETLTILVELTRTRAISH